jgi:hypothetical protein
MEIECGTTTVRLMTTGLRLRMMMARLRSTTVCSRVEDGGRHA